MNKITSQKLKKEEGVVNADNVLSIELKDLMEELEDAMKKRKEFMLKRHKNIYTKMLFNSIFITLGFGACLTAFFLLGKFAVETMINYV